MLTYQDNFKGKNVFFLASDMHLASLSLWIWKKKKSKDLESWVENGFQLACQILSFARIIMLKSIGEAMPGLSIKECLYL